MTAPLDWSDSYLRAKAAMAVAEKALLLADRRKAYNALTAAIEALEQTRTAITEKAA